MLTKHRKKYAKMVAHLAASGLPRKQALYRVATELKGIGAPASRRTLYRWMKEFGVRLR